MQVMHRTEAELFQRQVDIEELYSKRRVKHLIRQELLASQEIVDSLKSASEAVQAWLEKDYYPAKQKRLSGLKGMNLTALLTEIMVTLMQLDHAEQLTATAGRIVGCLHFEDAVAGVTTAAELLVHLAEADLIDLGRDKQNSIIVIPVYQVSPALAEHIRHTMYLPPMVVPPLKLTQNYSGGLLTEESSVILKRGHHEEDVCLDHLNTVNQVPLRLNLEFLCRYSPEPDLATLDDPDKLTAWKQRMKQAFQCFSMLAREGNRFWLTHKYDKRGRTYAQGYQVSYQGDEFRKAIVELADGETINIPEEYRYAAAPTTV